MNKEVKELKELLKTVRPELLEKNGLALFNKINEILNYINQLEQENKQLKERIEYYYEFDEYLKKEDLPEELHPYYKNQDCCRYIVELRKENEQLETNIEEAIKYIKSNPNVFYGEYLIDVETLLYNECIDEIAGEIKFISNLLSILERGKE